MKPKIVLINVILLLFILLSCTKHHKAKHREREREPFEVGIKKDTLYFIWEDSNNYLKPYYSDRENALVFICCNGEVFLFEDGSVLETLNIKNLNNYKISSLNNLDSINKEWHKKNPTFAPQKYDDEGKPLPLIFNKMFGYVVYIIVIGKDKKNFTIYPVIWWGLDPIDCSI